MNSLSGTRSVRIGFACLTIITVAAIIILASTPPVSRDALTHHLFVPRLYLEHGRMVELPHIEFSYYPQLVDLLYCIPLYFKNDIVPKYLHFVFALAAAWLIYRYLRDRLSAAYGWLGALFFLTLPVIIRLSITAYVDLGLIFFTAAAMMALLAWRKNAAGWGHLVLAGLFAGLAAGVKYNGMIVIFLLALFVPFLMPGQIKSNRRMAGRLFVFLLAAMAVFSPWLVKNYLWTKNPVYPLGSRVFIEAARDDGELPEESGLPHFLVRKYVYHEKWWQTVATPVRIFFSGRDDDPKFFDGVLSPFLFLLPFLAFRGAGEERRRDLRFFLWFSVLYILLAFLKTDMRIRYIGPAIPALTILAVFGLYHLKHTVLPRLTSSGRLVNTVFGAVTVMMFAYNYYYLAGQFPKVQPLSYLTGQVTRDAYIERYVREYPLVRYINEYTPEGSRILALFVGRRGYYFDREVRFSNSLFPRQYGNAPGSAEDLRRLLREKGFTHILVRYDLFADQVSRLPDSDQRLLVRAFFNDSVRLLRAEAGYGIYEIILPGSSNQERSEDPVG